MTSTMEARPGLSEFYDSEAPDIPEPTRAILTKYSGIPEEQIVQHVKDVRDKAWRVFQYPCLGIYAFLNLTVVGAPQYDAVLQNLKKGATFLDLGCCFGQVIRKLVFDGAPGENLTGSELEPAFVELGYELFKDKQKLKATFTTGDFFSSDIGGLKGQSFDYIYGGSFFHLFGWDEQVEALSRAVGLLKARGMILGYQTGAKKAQSRSHASARSSEMYSHNAESLQKLVSEVAEQMDLVLRTEVNVVGSATRGIPSDGGDWQYLRFSITRC